MTMPTNPLRQSGSALIVSLIMLTLLTLFVLSAINSGTMNLRIAANTQAQDEARAVAQRALAQFISTSSNFSPTPKTTTTSFPTISVNDDTTGGSGDYSVVISAPVCKRAAKQDPPRQTDCINGWNQPNPVYCVDTLWEMTATATRTSTGVSQSITQGVVITYPPNGTPTACAS
jgi:Tfp pilus assembly protein PilX